MNPEPDAALTTFDDFFAPSEPGKVVPLNDSFLYTGHVAVAGPSKLLTENQSVDYLEQLQEAGEVESNLWDAFDDFDTDQLADENLDKFMDLSQFFVNDSLPFEVPQPETQSVVPVISVPTAEGIDPHHFDILDLLEGESTLVEPGFLEHGISTVTSLQPLGAPPSTPTIPSCAVYAPEATSSSTGGSIKKGSRKRKAKPELPSGPVKTSLFEIPGETAVYLTVSPMVSPTLDHDYLSTHACDSTTGNVPDPSSTTTEVQVDKQSLRRHKNNIASKRSREQRKQKLSSSEKECENLVVRNEKLRGKITELEKLSREMKAVLIAKMAGK